MKNKILTSKIIKIEYIDYDDFVFNLELESKDHENDDLFWIEQTTGIITHNCFPKDTNALNYFLNKLGTPHDVLEATIKERNKMRKD